MHEHVDFVVAGGVQAEKLAIERVRKPGQGMIVLGVKRRERPFHRIERETRLYRRIDGDVHVVVIVKKAVVND